MRQSMAAAARRQDPARRVLVVEDETGVCPVIDEILGEAGFDADCVHRDRAAYSMLSGDGPYDALIVDVNLGAGTTGFDVARFARQMRPSLPVLYLSGDATEASFRAFGVPGSGFVAKPFAPEELIRRLRLLAEDDEG